MELVLDPVIPLMKGDCSLDQLFVEGGHVDMEVLLSVLLKLDALDGLRINVRVPAGKRQGIGQECGVLSLGLIPTTLYWGLISATPP